MSTATSSAEGTTTGGIDCIEAPTGLIAWWRAEWNFLDEVAGSNGDEVGGAQLTADGFVGQGIQFDGVDHALLIGTPGAIQGGAGSFSVEAWARFDGLDLRRVRAIPAATWIS